METSKTRKNARKPSRYRGVRYCHKAKAWRAKCKEGRSLIWISYHEDEIEAAKAYDQAALIYQQDRAVTNFPRSSYA